MITPSRDEFIEIQWLHDFTILSNELSGLASSGTTRTKLELSADATAT
jgi:hypothetical protein